MIFDSLRGLTPKQILILFLTRLFIVFCVLPVHEYAHALFATKQGDMTAKMSGRLTLNPLAHIDPIGALMIFLVGFGYAKPVPVNIRNFKNRKKGMAITALAGPVSNLLMSFISIILMYSVGKIFMLMDNSLIVTIILFLQINAIININLAVFNLIPIPPLDGSRLAAVIIPDKYYYKIMQYERYIMIGVLILLFTGLLSGPLSSLSHLILRLFNRLAMLLFKIEIPIVY